MWGIIPAAGAGSRIQPLAFSKELLPVGSRVTDGIERPKAVSEYLIDRMIRAGTDRICFVISPGKTDIMQYFGSHAGSAGLCYIVQPRPSGLCDAVFSALPFLPHDDDVVVGLPDTVWFPDDGLTALPAGVLSFLLFPVQSPHLFDAVVTDDQQRVRTIEVKIPVPSTHWVWGAFRMPVLTLHALHELWEQRGRTDEYIGTLVNAYIARGGAAVGVRAGAAYVDVGTLHGYREAMGVLAAQAAAPRAVELSAATPV